MTEVQWLHRTCAHRAPQIVAAGVVTVHPQTVLQRLELSWFTMSASATRVQLGLTAKTLTCDRYEFLFRVVDEDLHLIHHWGDMKRVAAFAPLLPGARRLDAVRGTRPGLWGVAMDPVRVEPMFPLP